MSLTTTTTTTTKAAVLSRKPLREGTYGRVIKTTMTDGRIFAVKETSLTSEQYRTSANREAAFFVASAVRKHEHKHIIRAHNVAATSRLQTIILEFMPGGDLVDHINAYQGKIGWYYAMTFFRQLSSAVAFLHSN